MTLPFDFVAAGGPDNVWIIKCGCAADWTSFAAFRAAVAGNRVDVTPLGNHSTGVVSGGFSVRFESPSQGLRHRRRMQRGADAGNASREPD